MDDWKKPVGGGRGSRNYSGPNGTAEKVDYSRVPIGGESDDEAGGDDWIQRQIRGHKASSTLLKSDYARFARRKRWRKRVDSRTDLTRRADRNIFVVCCSSGKKERRRRPQREHALPRSLGVQRHTSSRFR